MADTLSPPTSHGTNRRSLAGSWDSLDAPLGFKAADTNLNRYVGNSPTNLTDPSGLFKSEVHRRITLNALKGTKLSKYSIELIATRNVAQDDGWKTNSGPFADPLNHGDDNRIADTIKRINERLHDATKATTPEGVLVEFGKIAHAIQDLYSHSTYVEEADKKAGKKSKKGDIPTWEMCDKTGAPLIPKGVVTGNYVYPLKIGVKTPSPTHAELNKDAADQPRGAERNLAHTTYFELAEDVATRHTTEAWEQLFKQLSPEMQKKIIRYHAFDGVQ